MFRKNKTKGTQVFLATTDDNMEFHSTGTINYVACGSDIKEGGLESFLHLFNSLLSNYGWG